MKKLLALVLALVMTLSLAMVGTNAAFKDADKINNQEAVDVMALVGVLKGDENGNFNPADKIHRDAAAKIISYLKLGDGETADAIPGSESFTDVAVSNWAAGYIAYCATEGIINGDGAGHFFPANNVTGYEFGKMLLVVLGYNPGVDGLTGENWQVNTAKLMKQKGLLTGVTTAASQAITREEAAQMAFNALKANMVEGDAGTTVTVGGVPVTTGGSKSKDIEPAVKLMADLYPGLECNEKSSNVDAFGRQLRTWTLNKNAKTAVTVPASNADLSYVGMVSGKTLLADLGLKANATIASDKITITKNNKAISSKTVDKDATNIFNSKHSEVEVYDNGDGTYDVIVVEYKFGNVSTVNTKEGTITVAGKTFKATGYEKGDAVLYTEADGEIQSVQTPKAIDGKVTALTPYSSYDRVTINGENYNADSDKAPLKMKGTFYQSVDSYIVGYDEENVEAPAELYAYVYSIIETGSSKVSEDGFESDTKTLTAYYVDGDGVTGKAVVNAKDTRIKNASKPGEGDTGVYQYSLTANGEFKTESDKLAPATVVVNKDTKKIGSDFLSSKTEFVFVDTADSKLTVSTKTGYKNVDISDKAVVIANKDKVVTVFVMAKAAAEKSDAMYAFLKSTKATQTLDAKDNIVYNYTVIADGKETKLVGDKDTFASFEAGQYFEYTLKDGKLDTVTKVAADITGAEYVETIDDYIVYKTGKTVDLASGCVILDGEDNFKATTLEKGDEISIYLNSKGAAEMIVVTKNFVEE